MQAVTSVIQENKTYHKAKILFDYFLPKGHRQITPKRLFIGKECRNTIINLHKYDPKISGKIVEKLIGDHLDGSLNLPKNIRFMSDLGNKVERFLNKYGYNDSEMKRSWKIQTNRKLDIVQKGMRGEVDIYFPETKCLIEIKSSKSHKEFYNQVNQLMLYSWMLKEVKTRLLINPLLDKVYIITDTFLDYR